MDRVSILMVEDQESDAELLIAELRRAGFDPVWRRVTSEQEYLARLDSVEEGQVPDVILADYNLPQFSGIRALELVQERGFDIPFILVSGTVGEDVAVDSVKLGADDYLLKDRLARLGPAIRQALARKELRDAARRAEHEARAADRRAIVEYAKLLERLNNLAQRVGTASDTTEVFRGLSDFSVESVPINGLFVSLLDPATSLRTCVYAMSEHKELDVSELPPLGLTGSPASRAIESGEVVITGDFQADIAGRPRVDLGMERDPRLPQSSLAVPLVVMGRVIGAFEVQSVLPGAYTNEHVTAMRMAANLAAIAVENVQLIEHEQRRSRELAALNAVILAASGSDEMGGVLRVALDRLLGVLNLDTGVVWLGGQFATAGVPDDAAARVDRMTREAGLELSLGGLLVENWSAEDLPETARLFAPVAAEVGTRAAIAVPIFSGERRVGAIAALAREPRPWTPDDHALVTTIARELGRASERRWTQERMLRQLENLTTLYASAKKLSESLNLEALTDYVVRTAVDSFGVRAASVRRASPDGSLVALVTHPGDFMYPQKVRMRWNDAPGVPDPVGRALHTGLPSVRDDVETAADLPDDRRAALQAEGIRSTASLPLIARDTPFGILSLYSEQPGFFRPGRVEHFQAFANLVAAALENARLFDETRKHLAQLQALRDIDTAISGSLDARVTLNIFLDKVTTHLGVDAAAILVFNPRSQTLEYLTGRGLRTTALQHTRLRLGAGYAGQAALERRTISVSNLRDAKGELERSRQFADEEFVSYFATPLVAKGQTQGVLEVFHRQSLMPDQEWMDFLSTLAGQAAIAIDSTTLFNNLQRANIDLTMAYDTTLEGWSKALDLRDRETEGHTQRVTELSMRLARALGMPDQDLVHVRRGGLLHDIGKMGIPDSILLKPGPLSEEEWGIMRQHPVFAYQLLSPIAYLRPALAIPYAHHEKWDGTGYPRGLKGDEIPLEARVFAVVDVWDALTSDRPYRPAWPGERAREYIREQAGRHFDPNVAETFLQMIGDMNHQS
jgi:response regulator RpfG family c-di-GMP phosphodiesterase